MVTKTTQKQGLAILGNIRKRKITENKIRYAGKTQGEILTRYRRDKRQMKRNSHDRLRTRDQHHDQDTAQHKTEQDNIRQHNTAQHTENHNGAEHNTHKIQDNTTEDKTR
jgi:hypothetical protein